MASAQPSQDICCGHDRHPAALRNVPSYHRLSADASDQCAMETAAPKHDHCPSALHEGHAVRVFSRSAGKWVDGEVVKFVEGNSVSVEYAIGECWCRKIFRMHSKHLIIPATIPDDGLVECDPDANFAGFGEARQALRQYLEIHVNDKLHGFVTDVLRLQDVRNNAFICSLAGEPFTAECRVNYKGRDNEDVLVKIHYLDAGKYTPDDLRHFKEYDFLHGLLPHKHACDIHPGCKKYFLGITIHKDLSTDFRTEMGNMSKEKRQKRQSMISHLLEGRWKKRGEIDAETIAERADFLISYCSKNKDVNNEILQHLGAMSVPFCTDTSLGIGMHFFNGEDGNLQALNLGRHAFGVPPRGWLEEYIAAANQTRKGVLILNPSIEYFFSKACQQEFLKIPRDRIFALDLQSKKIYPAGEPQDLKFLAHLAINRDPEPVKKKIVDALRERSMNTDHLAETCGFPALGKVRAKGWLNPLLYRMEKEEHLIRCVNPESNGKKEWALEHENPSIGQVSKPAQSARQYSVCDGQDGSIPDEAAILKVLSRFPGDWLAVREVYLHCYGKNPKTAQMGAGVSKPMKQRLYALQKQRLVVTDGTGKWKAT